MPSPGLVTLWHSPGGPGIRVESHIYSGYKVPPYYDSMIGKLIAHGASRDAAFARMRTRSERNRDRRHQDERSPAPGNLSACRIPGRRHRYSLSRETPRPGLTSSSTTVAWQQFVMKLDTLDPDTVEKVFSRCGACVGHAERRRRQPGTRARSGRDTALDARRASPACSPGDADLARLRRRAARGHSDSWTCRRTVSKALLDRDWEREWLNDFGPMRFGSRLWISPGDSRSKPQDAVIVRLDPGLAFGTGTHATTALCLEWLDGLPLAGRSLLDYGCGSGVLAIAALKLGCRSATAIDIDPQALTATRQNAARNNVIGAPRRSARRCLHRR